MLVQNKHGSEMFKILRNVCAKSNRILFSSTASRFIKCKTFSTSIENTRKFMNFFPKIVKDLTDAVKVHDETVMVQWLHNLLDHNVPLGKCHRGVTTVLAYKEFCKPSDDDLQLANYLGWCVEMVHGALIILDDIMDKSETRRGQLCWYKMPGIDLSAINDAVAI